MKDISLSKIKKEIASVKSLSKLNEVEKKYLRKDGIITKLFKEIPSLELSKRKEFGQKLNAAKGEINKLIQERKEKIEFLHLQKELEYDIIDVTAPMNVNQQIPHTLPNIGTMHPINKEIEHLSNIFSGMGFIIEECKGMDDDYHNFESLGIPKGHPARDIWDTFWTESGYLPPTHTSTMQVRLMKKFSSILQKHGTLKIAIPGRVYRNEATDATHEHTLHQIEGIYIGENVSIANMIQVIKTFLEAFFERESLKIQLQPSYFPFVEPGMQYMSECVFCGGKGCNICKYTGMVELIGCGMIHPVVLENANIDTKKYSGFAFGAGIDRMVMLKYSIKDIRWLQSGDLRFLKQFI